MKKRRLVHTFLTLLALMLSCQATAEFAPAAVPEPLKTWIPWALDGEASAGCPYFFNDADSRHCAWPGMLEIKAGERDATFAQNWQVYRDSTITLPGDDQHWPQEVSVDGKTVAVISHNDLPTIRLAAGTHHLTGRLAWRSTPESLALASDTGLLRLELDGRNIAWPVRDEENRLWLQRKQDTEGEEQAQVRVYRKITDGVPVTVETRLRLEVSGKNREITLGRALLGELIPQELESPLPTALAQDGSLKVQARAGTWEITFVARHPGPVKTLTLPPAQGLSAEEEIWVFQASPLIRTASIEEAPSVDPQQTTLPAEWRTLPSYLMRDDTRFGIKEVRRGDSEPAPDKLALARRLWLSFDGTVLTVHDRLQGDISRASRLTMSHPAQLGRVDIDGGDQLITRDSNGLAGIEVKRGRLTIGADSLIPGSPRQLPAVGWQHDFDNVSADLALPAGWRLLHARGADRAEGEWLMRWNLLDFFLVLVIALAVGQLWGYGWGALSLAGLVLAYQEPGAPGAEWLILLAAVAVYRVLPEGRFKGYALWARHLSLLGLILMSLNFATTQVRSALYPVLEATEGYYQPYETALAPAAEVPAAAPAADAELLANDENEAAPTESKSMRLRSRVSKPEPKKQQLRAYQTTDPDAKVQTGPGLPDWNWHNYRLVWNGPVRADQQLDLWLISPAMNKLLVVLRLVLLALLLARIAGWPKLGNGSPLASGLRRRAQKILTPALCLACAIGLGALTGSPTAEAAATAKPTAATSPSLPPAAPSPNAAPSAPAHATAMPSPELLAELKAKLTRPAECLPECAELSLLSVQLVGTTLRLGLDIDAAIDSALPLPGGAKQWVPQEALLDGKPAYIHRDEEGNWWLLTPAGHHRVELTGEMTNRDTVQLSLLRKPRRISVSADGWDVAGISDDSGAADTLQLSRRIKAGDPAEAPVLPPFLRVERRLFLDLVWRVETTVSRASPTGVPALVQIPLLPGEAVNSAGVVVKDGQVLVNLGPQAESVSWSSSLTQQADLKLVAPQDSAWVESWSIAAAGLWHVTATGIPPVALESGDEADLSFRPWPGETVALHIERPQAVAGQTLTIDNSTLTVIPGNRATDYKMLLSVRSSRGIDHPITLPEGAVLQHVSINGQVRPIRASGHQVILPLTPGKQSVEVAWRTDQGMSMRYATLPAGLGQASVNHHLRLQLPDDRWLLALSGPGIGPAILFWAKLVLLIAAAIGLGRLSRLPVSTWQWVLLALGLTQVDWWAAALVVAWFFAIDRRRILATTPPRWRFNLGQAGLIVLTLIQLGILFSAVQGGLLGRPDMQITGNGSSASQLLWYVDRADAAPGSAWIVTLPLLAYRALMLLWALWLARSLLAWLKWGWNAFASGGLWQRKPTVAAAQEAPRKEGVNTP